MVHLRAWVLVGIGFTIIALLGTALCHVILLMLSSSEMGARVYQRVVGYFISAFIVAILWTGTFAASYFLELIQQTAAGTDAFDPPDDSIGEKFFTFWYVAWLAFCSLVPF